MKIITSHSMLFLELLISLFTTTSSAQWVKQNLPSIPAGIIYYPFAAGKNSMWTYTRSVQQDTVNIHPSIYIRTSDGGQTYTSGTIFDNINNLYPHIQPRDGENADLIAADGFGNFYMRRTNDGGATWQDMSFKPQTFPDVIYYWDENNGVYVGDPDSLGLVIMYTTNNGSTFQRLPNSSLPPTRETEVAAIGEYQAIGNILFFSTYDYMTNDWRVWRTLDRGRTWTAGEWFQPGTASGFTARYAFANAQHGILLQGIAAESKNPLYTEDGGLTWHESGKMPGQVTWAIDNIPNTQTFMAFFQDTISGMLFSALTNDLGRTWNSRKNIESYVLDSIFEPLGFPLFVFTNLDIVNNNAAWGRFSRTDFYRYESTEPIVPLKPDLDLQLTADNDGLPLYGSIKYTLTVKNRGISPATGVKINWLPPYKRTNNGAGAFAYQSAYASTGWYDSWNGVWSIDQLDAGASATASFHLFVVDNTKDVTQTAQVIATNENDLDSSPNNMSGAGKEDDEVRYVSHANNVGTIRFEPYKEKMTEFAISPNPAVDKLTIAIRPANEKEWSIRILNSIGQTVISQNGQSYQLLDVDVKSLNAGLYIVEYQSDGERKVEKVLVQH